MIVASSCGICIMLNFNLVSRRLQLYLLWKVPYSIQIRCLEQWRLAIYNFFIDLAVQTPTSVSKCQFDRLIVLQNGSTIISICIQLFCFDTVPMKGGGEVRHTFELLTVCVCSSKSVLNNIVI